MEQDWEVATQQDTGLGRDCRAVGWDSRGEMGSEGRESRRGGELCLGEALSYELINISFAYCYIY